MELMEWVFEMRMEISQLESEMELNAMLMQVQSEYDQKIDEITQYFATENYEQVKSELEKTQYLSQMLTDIELKIVEIRDNKL